MHNMRESKYRVREMGGSCSPSVKTQPATESKPKKAPSRSDPAQKRE